MSNFIDNQQRITEIIFANRNKAYGAYLIRSSYGSTLARALAVTMFTFIGIMSGAYYLSHMNDVPPQEQGNLPFIDSLQIVEFKLDEPKHEQPKQPETPKSEPLRNGGSDPFATHVVDSLPANTSTVTNDLAAGTGSTTNAGPTGPVTGTASGTSTGTGTGTSTIETPIEHIADSNPEFEGGLPALYRFLSGKLVYPEIAKEIGKEGTVYVRFVVDEYGRVGMLSLLNNVGFGLDEEALRVVAQLPKFSKPGIKNGKACKVYFQLPIKFRLR